MQLRSLLKGSQRSSAPALPGSSLHTPLAYHMCQHVLSSWLDGGIYQ